MPLPATTTCPRYYRRYCDEPDLVLLSNSLEKVVDQVVEEDDAANTNTGTDADVTAVSEHELVPPLCSVRDLHTQLCCFLEMFSKLPMRGLYQQELLRAIFMVSE